jgi:hypothetical protein
LPLYSEKPEPRGRFSSVTVCSVMRFLGEKNEMSNVYKIASSQNELKNKLKIYFHNM